MVVLTGMVDISLLRIEDADQELCKKIHVYVHNVIEIISQSIR